jgi:hypothetical protein
MQGGSRNQLELMDEFAPFFGHQARSSGIVMMRLAAGGEHFPCDFVHRGDEYGHKKDRWRLCLPTAEMGAPEYASRVVRLDKVEVDGSVIIHVSVTDRNSADHEVWRERSAPPDGETGTTRGGREYGWWS